MRLLLGEAEVALGTLARVVDALDRGCFEAVAAGVEGYPGDPVPPDPKHWNKYSGALKNLAARIADLAWRAADASAPHEGNEGAAPCSWLADCSPPHGDSPCKFYPLLPLPPPDVPASDDSAFPALVEVEDGLTVEAMVLPANCDTPEAVLHAIRGPMLCFVQAWNHFAIRLGDHLLHGNIGSIYPAGTRRPCRVKHCNGGCSGSCPYYHDPALPSGAGKKEIRNFVADSFAYRPLIPLDGGARFGRRRFGSAGSLRADLATLAPAEVRRFLDQVAHDLVCAAVLLHNA